MGGNFGIAVGTVLVDDDVELSVLLAVAKELLRVVELEVSLEVDVDSFTLSLDGGGIDELSPSPMEHVVFAISSSGWGGKLAKLSPTTLLLPSRLGRRSLPAINPRLNLRRRNGDGPFVVDIILYIYLVVYIKPGVAVLFGAIISTIK